MSGSLSPKRRKLYIAAQDITGAPPWATDLAARRKDLTLAEKAECVTRLRSEHNWSYAQIAKLFGVASQNTPANWVAQNTMEGRARLQSNRQARIDRDPYAEARYQREWRGRRNHGASTDEIRAMLWHQQNGRCYLCGDPLDTNRMGVIDHDHRCCPVGYSCRVCRRGLACHECNLTAGRMQDDPDRLARVAANLRAAKNAVTRRMKSTGSS